MQDETFEENEGDDGEDLAIAFDTAIPQMISLPSISDGTHVGTLRPAWQRGA